MMHICVYICIMFTYIFISIKQKQDGAADAQQQRAHVAAGYPCSSHPRPGARMQKKTQKLLPTMRKYSTRLGA